MTGKQDHYNWKTKHELGKGGIHLQGQQITFHSTDETMLHAVVKTMLAKLLSKAGHNWSCEVPVGDKTNPVGYIDILDLGSPEREPVALEIESHPSPQKKEEKREKYVIDPIRDVLILDLRECPSDLEGITGFLKNEIPWI